MKKICKILNNLIFNQEKFKNVQISFDRFFEKIFQFFFAKLVQFVSLCQKLSKKQNFIKI